MKIKIVSPSPAHVAQWRTALTEAGQGDVAGVEAALQHVNVLVNGSRPDLVVAESTEPAAFDALEKLAQRHPELEFVLVTSDLSPETLMRAMRCGVREVLPGNVSSSELLEAVQRLARKRGSQAAVAASSGRHGEVLAFVSCKGGSGATFVAANLAHVLSRAEARRVVLVDLNLQFGDAALFIGTARPSSDLSEVARNFQRLDRELLQASLTQVSDRLWVLAAPDDPARAGDVQPQHVETVVGMLRTMFDYVVIDTGRSLSAVTIKALDQCDHLYVVLQLTLPFIRDARRLHELFHSLDYPARKVSWVVNRHQKNNELTLEDLKKALAVEKIEVLPNQYEVVTSSVNQGVPVDDLAPSSPIAKALRALAARIAPEPAPERTGWFGGLFKSGTGAGRSGSAS